MAEQNQTDWRGDLTPQLPKLKMKDGEIARFRFLDEGKKSDGMYGVFIRFRVVVQGEETAKHFDVRGKNYDLLNQLKALGKLEDVSIELARRGSNAKDTRYFVKKL